MSLERFGLIAPLCVCVCARMPAWTCVIVFNVEVQLDQLKQKGAVRRALFLDTQQASLQRKLKVPNEAKVCHETKIYLRVSRINRILKKINR